MNRMFEREILVPGATQISIEPMPTALAVLPPNPFMLMVGMGQRDLKSERLGET